MSPETLEALRGSIAKWKAIVEGTGVDDGAENCPLCQMFPPYLEEEDGCAGCPVAARTGWSGCSKTPYIDWKRTFSRNDDFPLTAETERQKAAAQAELDFLISLLPEGEAP